MKKTSMILLLSAALTGQMMASASDSRPTLSRRNTVVYETVLGEIVPAISSLVEPGQPRKLNFKNIEERRSKLFKHGDENDISFKVYTLQVYKREMREAVDEKAALTKEKDNVDKLKNILTKMSEKKRLEAAIKKNAKKIEALKMHMKGLTGEIMRELNISSEEAGKIPALERREGEHSAASSSSSSSSIGSSSEESLSEGSVASSSAH